MIRFLVLIIALCSVVNASSIASSCGCKYLRCSGCEVEGTEGLTCTNNNECEVNGFLYRFF